MGGGGAAVVQDEAGEVDYGRERRLQGLAIGRG